MSRPTPPTDTNKNQDQPPANSQNNTPGLTFDWRDWLPYFEDQDIPEAQKRELIETLWQIIVAFVDLGFDLNPHQQAEQKSCGQNLDLKMLLEAAVLKSAAVQEANDRKCLPMRGINAARVLVPCSPRSSATLRRSKSKSTASWTVLSKPARHR